MSDSNEPGSPGKRSADERTAANVLGNVLQPGANNAATPANAPATYSSPENPYLPPPGATPALTHPNSQILPIVFNGSGREYFGIWIVNILLIIVTLTLYYPWARVRKLVYFAENTEVGGYPLSFHGKAKQMFIGFFLALSAGLLYTFSQQILPALSGALLAVYLLAWPWVFRMANRFRLAKTEWRGLRFGFTGTNAGAYLAMFVPLAVYGVIFGISTYVGLGSMETENVSKEQLQPIFIAIAVMTLIGLLAAPYIFFLIKRYQHNNLAYASLQTQFTATAGNFYWIYFKTALVGLLALTLAIGITVLAVLVTGVTSATLSQMFDFDVTVLIILGTVVSYLLIYTLWIAIGSYMQAALFNLTWSSTISDRMRFRPSLSFLSLLGVKLKNTLLIVLTLGAYIPFAQIAIAKLKLHALKVETEQNVDNVIADVRSGRVSATLDAAADMLDIDIGL